MLSSNMTIVRQIHDLVDELPDDPPLLTQSARGAADESCNRKAVEDVRDGRTYSAGDFMAKAQQRWPHKSSE